MCYNKFWSATAGILILFLSCRSPETSDQWSLANKRVLFLGNSITQNGTYVSMIEYLLRKHNPGANFDMISIGLSSETVSCLTEEDHPFPRPCLRERLGRALEKVRPGLVVACYGMNDGIYHPQAPERMKNFQEGIIGLIESVQEYHIPIVLVTPPVFDSLPVSEKLADEEDAEFSYRRPFRKYDQVLTDYSHWLLSMNRPRVKVIDWHGPMKGLIRQQRKRIPEFTFSSDGIHPSSAGHLLMARLFLQHFGFHFEKGTSITEETIMDDPLYHVVDHRRKLRSTGWLPYVGYTRGETVTKSSIEATEIRAKQLNELILSMNTASKKGSFGYDHDFLKVYCSDLILLQNGPARLILSPAWQGRVMTSTAAGPEGTSFGWINYKLIASGLIQEHMNPFGGEERFWLGPEGGQFSVFFKNGVPFDLENWYTPRVIDLDPFELQSKSDQKAVFFKRASLQNYSGFTFHLEIERTVELLSKDQIRELLDLPAGLSIEAVAFQSTNLLRNAGAKPWEKETGLLSIWLLGMFNPSPATTVVIPFVEGPEELLGSIVNDDYFGKVPGDRLQVSDGFVYFKADGRYRSKIGLSPLRAKEILGSYDPAHQTLTILRYDKPQGILDYVNSQWELQKHPYQGDVINSYNDGPPEPGAEPLGPFYELESSSPALSLKAGETGRHVQQTFHFQGDKAQLDKISIRVFGIGLDDIATALD